jgi:GT2 family glycosyltransferase
MKIALISTVFNEGASMTRWINALRAQTVQPDEFVIVDGVEGVLLSPEAQKHLSIPGGSR